MKSLFVTARVCRNKTPGCRARGLARSCAVLPHPSFSCVQRVLLPPGRRAAEQREDAMRHALTAACCPLPAALQSGPRSPPPSPCGSSGFPSSEGIRFRLHPEPRPPGARSSSPLSATFAGGCWAGVQSAAARRRGCGRCKPLDHVPRTSQAGWGYLFVLTLCVPLSVRVGGLLFVFPSCFMRRWGRQRLP